MRAIPMSRRLLIVEVEGSDAEIDYQLDKIMQIASAMIRLNCAKAKSPRKGANLAGRKVGVRRDGADQRLHVS